MLNTTTTPLPAWIIRQWEKNQQHTLHTIGAPTQMIARGQVVTVTRMDIPTLRTWSWMTDEWEGRTYGDLAGYTITDTDGRELGIILQRGRLTHGEWLNPTTGDYEFAAEVRTLQIAANYIIDRHDHLARTAGTPRHAQDDQDAREDLIRDWWASWQPVEPEPVADGTRVIYTGTLRGHHGQAFTLHHHNHMYTVTDLEDECGCDSKRQYTLVSLDEHRVLLHVDRSHVEPAA